MSQNLRYTVRIYICSPRVAVILKNISKTLGLPCCALWSEIKILQKNALLKSVVALLRPTLFQGCSIGQTWQLHFELEQFFRADFRRVPRHPDTGKPADTKVSTRAAEAALRGETLPASSRLDNLLDTRDPLWKRNLSQPCQRRA